VILIYFGQFVDHDITLSGAAGNSGGPHVRIQGTGYVTVI